ncbi:Mu transposase domain-containing protein [Bacillus sp. Bva_UNVM-123]|uniref:Mu transposase domain-containing protein n=1 Tax=Bacillus sp. Bva_UNVM-123 TaxID=2829798 RepID=UPI00391F6F46
MDGFIHAFEFLGGVPTEGLLDNLKTAVQKVLQGRDRLEQDAFIGLQVHYVFKAEFCNPASGNEKGRVEGAVGYVRRNALVPYPEVQSMDVLNEFISWIVLKEANRTHVPNKSEKVLEMWVKEKEHLHPLPANRFEACKLVSRKENKTSLITVETNHYSVPCSYAGQTVWVKNFVDRVIVVAQNRVIAEHPRSYESNQIITILDHYLEVLLKKPRAIRDSHAFQSSEVPDVFRRFHLKMREQEGSASDQKFIRLLLLHRDIGMENSTNALLEAKKTQVFRYEKVHEIIRLSPVELELVAELKIKGDKDFLNFFPAFGYDFSNIGGRSFKIIFIYQSLINFDGCMLLLFPDFLIINSSH